MHSGKITLLEIMHNYIFCYVYFTTKEKLVRFEKNENWAATTIFFLLTFTWNIISLKNIFTDI